MAWNGSGVFARLYSWVTRRDAGSPTNIIDATTMDAEFDNYKTGLENCVTLDGQTTPTANLPMGGFRHLNVSAAALRAQYGRVTEIQDGVIWRAASPGGTINAMTGTLAPAPSAYTAGMIITIIVPGSGSNTITAPTLEINLLGAKIIRKHQAALVAGDYSAGDTLVLLYDGTYFELLNAKSPNSIDISALTTDATGGAVGDFIPFVDVSESNAGNKVTFQNLLDNAFANFTADTTGGATGDKLLFSDASESNVAQVVTADNFMLNALQLLTTDTTGGAVGDFIAFVDVSDSNNGNKVAASDLFYNYLNNNTADTAPDPDADHVLTRDNSATATKKVLIKDLASSSNVDAPGYKGAPVVAADSSTSFALTDCGKTWYHTSGSAHTWTIPANASVAFPIGTIILLENENGGGNVTVAITSDTLRWNSSTGSRTLAANGSAAIKKVAATTWRITGNGIT